MPKKKMNGVIVFGCYFIMSGLFLAFSNLFSLIKTLRDGLTIFEEPVAVLFFLLGVFVILLGLNVLRLKDVWRKAVIYYCGLSVLLNIVLAPFSGIHFLFEYLQLFFSVLIGLLTTYYFTRPKVAARFN